MRKNRANVRPDVRPVLMRPVLICPVLVCPKCRARRKPTIGQRGATVVALAPSDCVRFIPKHPRRELTDLLA